MIKFQNVTNETFNHFGFIIIKRNDDMKQTFRAESFRWILDTSLVKAKKKTFQDSRVLRIWLYLDCNITGPVSLIPDLFQRHFTIFLNFVKYRFEK